MFAAPTWLPPRLEGWPLLRLTIGACILGALVPLLGYSALYPTHGAGLALFLAAFPLVLACFGPYPLLLTLVLSLILSVNCFGFLTQDAIYFRGAASVAILLLVIRTGRFNLKPLATATILYAILVLGSLISLFFKPSLLTFSLMVIWLIPFLGLYVGYGLQRDYADRFPDLWYAIATCGGAAISLVNIYQWAANGFAMKSFVIHGAFNNGNVTAAMLVFFAPAYLAMMADRRGHLRVIGSVALLLAIVALVVLVSRFALAMAILAPFFFLTRRLAMLIGPPLVLLMLWFGITNAGVLELMGYAAPVPNVSGEDSAIAKTFRIGLSDSSANRQFGYMLGSFFITQRPIEGYGFGAGRSLSLSYGFDSYGPENLFMQNLLEGGMSLLLTTLLLYLWYLFKFGIPIVFKHATKVTPFTYALGLSIFLIFGYDMSNSSQTHMSLRVFHTMALGALILRLPKELAAAQDKEPSSGVQ